MHNLLADKCEGNGRHLPAQAIDAELNCQMLIKIHCTLLNELPLVKSQINGNILEQFS